MRLIAEEIGGAPTSGWIIRQTSSPWTATSQAAKVASHV